MLAGFHAMLRTCEMVAIKAADLQLTKNRGGVLHLGLTKSGKRMGAPEVVTSDDQLLIAALGAAVRSA